MSVPASTRRLVFQRDGDECVHCGTTEGLTLQHRINRGLGGSKLRDGAANLLVLCGLSNQRLESSSAFADLGRVMGWKLRSWEDPETVPVRYASGDFYYLNDRGTRVLAEELER